MKLGFLNGLSTGNLGLGKTASGGGGGGDSIGDALRADAKAYWKMDEASGTRADATGRGNDLSVYDVSVPPTTGKVGDAARITHSTAEDYKGLIHERNADLGIFGNSVYYLFGWLKALAASQFEIIELNNLNNIFESDLSYDGTKFVFSAGNNGNISTGTQDVDTFYFVEYYYEQSSNTIGIAINGSAFSLDNTVSLNEATDSPYFSIGLGFADSTPGASVSHFDIDEVGILHRLPTADERAYLYNSGNGRTLYP